MELTQDLNHLELKYFPTKEELHATLDKLTGKQSLALWWRMLEDKEWGN